MTAASPLRLWIECSLFIVYSLAGSAVGLGGQSCQCFHFLNMERGENIAGHIQAALEFSSACCSTSSKTPIPQVDFSSLSMRYTDFSGVAWRRRADNHSASLCRTQKSDWRPRSRYRQIHWAFGLQCQGDIFRLWHFTQAGWQANAKQRCWTGVIHRGAPVKAAGATDLAASHTQELFSMGDIHIPSVSNATTVPGAAC